MRSWKKDNTGPSSYLTNKTGIDMWHVKGRNILLRNASVAPVLKDNGPQLQIDGPTTHTDHHRYS